MSKENVQKVIGRLVTDGEFAKSLFERPEEALKEYDLTEEEIVGLKAMKKEDVGQFVGSLDERISKQTLGVIVWAKQAGVPIPGGFGPK